MSSPVLISNDMSGHSCHRIPYRRAEMHSAPDTALDQRCVHSPSTTRIRALMQKYATSECDVHPSTCDAHERLAAHEES